MIDQILETLLGCASAIFAIVVGFFAWKFKKYKEKEEKHEQEIERAKDIFESYNRAMGKTQSHYNLLLAKDENGDYVLKLDPNIREALLKDLEDEIKHYHYFDRIKL